MKSIKDNKARIVVIGGGFSGLNFINHLSTRAFEVTLVDKNNFNSFTPLLYQVATGFLEPSNISYPLRKLVNRRGFNFRQGKLSSIDSAGNLINLTDGVELEYDLLVIAAGAKPNSFRNPTMCEGAFELRKFANALSMSKAFLRAFEGASA